MNIEQSATTPNPDAWDGFFNASAETPMHPEEPNNARDSSIALVKTCFDDGTFLACFPDGTEAMVLNDVFPDLSFGYPVVLYPVDVGGWSLVNPDWYIKANQGITIRQISLALQIDPNKFNTLLASNGFTGYRFSQSLSEIELVRLLEILKRELPELTVEIEKQIRNIGWITFGDSLSFTLTTPVATDSPILSGKLEDGTPVTIKRSDFFGLESLPLYDFTATRAVKKYKVNVVDPFVNPIRIGMAPIDDFKFEVYNPAGQHRVLKNPGLFFLALRELACRIDRLPASILNVSDEYVLLALYGIQLTVFPEQFNWYQQYQPRELYQRSQMVNVHIGVDLDHWNIFTSLRFPEEDSGWEKVRSQYPIGNRIAGTVCEARSREGVIVDVPSRNLRIHGLIPYGELTDGNDAVFLESDDLKALPDLLITGHDVDRRRLLLSLRQAHPSVWDRPQFHPGQVIPVKVAVRQASSWLVRWAAGNLAVLPVEGLPNADLFWSRVVEFDPASRHLRLEYWQTVVEWTVGDIASESLELRAVDGTTVRVEKSVGLSNLISGDRTRLVISNIVFRLEGPRITCRSLPADLSKALELLHQKAIQSIKLTDQTSDGYIGRQADGLEVFLPFSEVGIQRPKDLNNSHRESFRCRIIEINEDTGRIVVSGRILLEEHKKKMLSEIEPGQIRKGIVKKIVDFGAFVDLGGIDGLLHKTDMTWGRVGNPHEIVHIDQALEVFVISVDNDSEKIALGLKQKTQSPWTNVPDRYPIGSKHMGEVVNVMIYGAFVKLESGIEGLVHIKEMSWGKRINHPNEMVSIGDQIEVQVLNINKDKQEISLGMKQVQNNPWDKVAERYPPGTIVSGAVRNLTNYGAFIEIEQGIEGLLHVTDMSWVRKVTHPSEVVNKGDNVTCVVLNVDQERKRIALGLKQMNNGPWEGDIPGRYKAGELRKGKVTKLTNFGVCVELEPGLEGLLHNSELFDDKIESSEEVVKIGDEVDVRILQVDAANRKVSLSLRKPVEFFVGIEETSDKASANKPSHELRGGTGSLDPTVLPVRGAKELDRMEIVMAQTRPTEQLANPETVTLRPASTQEKTPSAEALPGSRKVELLNLVVITDEIASMSTLSPIESLPPDLTPASSTKVAAQEPKLPTTPSGFDPSRLFQRLPHGERANSDGDEEEYDGMLAVVVPAGNSTGDHREPDGDLDAWLQQISWDTDLPFALDQCRLHAVASLVRVTEGLDDLGPQWESLPAWASLLALLSTQSEVYDQAERFAARLESLLRALAGNPVEVLIYERLAEFIPPKFVLNNWQALERWLGQHAKGAISQTGLAILKIRACERLGQIKRAWDIANGALSFLHDDSLLSERERLVHLFRDQLKGRVSFFDRFDRDFTLQIRGGGFALVIPVRDRETGELAALKHYLVKNLMPVEMQQALDLFTHEANFLRRIRHVNVVGFRESLGPGCILLDWLAGRPLDPGSDVLSPASGWWTVRRVLEFGLSVASALEAVGRTLDADFTHNDLAPRNIMVAPESYPDPGWVKVIDFGLSSSPQFYSVSSVLDELGVRLREDYRAPEVADGGFGSLRSDIYALGVILFQMLTGHLPHDFGDASFDLVIRVATPGVANFLRRMLNPEPEKRPSNWHEVVQWLNGEVENA